MPNLAEKAAIAVALISGLTAITQTWLQTRRVNNLQEGSVGTLSEGQKVCRRVHKAGHYVDSIVVPAAWQPSDCQRYAKLIDRMSPPAPELLYSLACIFNDNTYIGDDKQVTAEEYASAPQKDCGWYK